MIERSRAEVTNVLRPGESGSTGEIKRTNAEAVFSDVNRESGLGRSGIQKAGVLVKDPGAIGAYRKEAAKPAAVPGDIQLAARAVQRVGAGGADKDAERHGERAVGRVIG